MNKARKVVGARVESGFFLNAPKYLIDSMCLVVYFVGIDSRNVRRVRDENGIC